MDINIVFMGSPHFAVPTLQSLQEQYSVVGVITQPDRPAGRGRNLISPPVKTAANNLGLPVIQPSRLKEPDAMDILKSWAPDLIVVAAYGQILRQKVLDMPKFGCLNIHASMLPRWRGAAPIQAALLEGDKKTGITIMRMDPGLDTGPIIRQKEILISLTDTAETLSEKLSKLGAELLLETIPNYLDGKLIPQEQNESQATYAPLLKKADGKLDFTRTAEELERKVRAFNPWPGTYMDWEGDHLKIYKVTCHLEIKTVLGQPGSRMIYQKKPAIVTTQGLLVLEEVQSPGKKSMPGKAFLNGVKGWET